MVWDDTRIEPADQFKKTIREAIDTARVAILLVSESFCRSEFIQETELPFLEEAAREGRLRLFWMLINTCNFKLASEIERLHAPYLPLAQMKDASQQLSTFHVMSRRLQQAF